MLHLLSFGYATRIVGFVDSSWLNHHEQLLFGSNNFILFWEQPVQRPYRIPIPDWAAFLIALPPTVGILAIFLVSNWYVYLFSIGAVLFSLVLHKLGAASKQRGWFTYETKAERIPYNLSPTIDLSTDDGTESDLSPVSNSSKKDYNYKIEELTVIQVQEENMITWLANIFSSWQSVVF